MKNTPALAVVLLVGQAIIGQAVHAAPASPLELKTATLHKPANGELSELVLSFQDKEPVSGACDLALSRFEYVEAIQTLMVTFKAASFCPREDFGKREGVLSWRLPSHLYQSSNLKLIVNDRALSDLKIAKGQVVIKTKP